MAHDAPAPESVRPFAAIIVAAGKGSRARQSVPKQFAPWRGKPLVRHSVEALLRAGAGLIVVAIPEGSKEHAIEAAGDEEGLLFVIGGETRQESVSNALQVLEAFEFERILIHDAARPGLDPNVVKRLLAAIDDAPGAVPVLPVVDSLAVERNGVMEGKADRETLRRVQTPQAFRFGEILSAHKEWQGERNAGDDAQVLQAAGGKVALVEGDERLRKLTFAEDFMTDLSPLRIGTGFDVHRLAEGEELWLGGVNIEHDKGLAGHSDADVAIHAIVDALLGAVAAGDIGQHFPPSDPQWKGAASDAFLRHALSLVEEAGYRPGNIDLTIICEAPRIGPHREAIRRRLADLLCLDLAQVSVKATTTERLGFTGRGEGIAAQAAATVIRND